MDKIPFIHTSVWGLRNACTTAPYSSLSALAWLEPNTALQTPRCVWAPRKAILCRLFFLVFSIKRLGASFRFYHILPVSLTVMSMERCQPHPGREFSVLSCKKSPHAERKGLPAALPLLCHCAQWGWRGSSCGSLGLPCPIHPMLGGLSEMWRWGEWKILAACFLWGKPWRLSGHFGEKVHPLPPIC